MSNKIYIKIIAAVVILCGLSMTVGYNMNNHCDNSVANHPLDSVGQDTIMRTQVLRFDYEGQEYIEFLRDGNSYMIHDPNYHVLCNKLNNITTVINRSTGEKINKLDVNGRANFRVILDKLNKIDQRLAKLEANQNKIIKQKSAPVKKVVNKPTKRRK